ncbi:putative SAM-dependent methyltransferase [Aliivibrio wodanis]|uniref:Putative SAM-dependent methyltransferase n=1 Tax=Aliivibrio wodanis TaxID=80852 RepID=A0A090IPU7_9GAMM|nr:putative SAM-dependent methyltransferase [Aliivibrio wodanis]
MDYSKLKPGDDNYRAYIGPPMQYDFMGATQFRLLCTLGLRSEHKVLDLGCGSLRAGRFLISYLEPDNYHGIEPNEWLIKEAIKNQIGDGMVDIKRPKFDHNSSFNTAAFDTSFDFIIAQSIFSHTGLDLLSNALANIQASLNEDGLALVTFIKGTEDFKGEGWIYPGCVSFSPKTIKESALKSGLYSKELPWYHPRQTWFLLSKDESQLPTEKQLTFLSGAVLRGSEFINSIQPYELKPSLNLPQKMKSLIISGFHRSATSATANYLFDAGLNMGANLMAGNISNAKGHYEDWDAVQLHDEQLVKNETNWQFHDDVSLEPANDFLDSYIQKRSNISSYWGVKDPRACLFLNEWKQALGDAGHYLFVARHWSSCIESLLHRHSRDLAYGLPKVNRDMVGAKFWIQPELAAKMWLSYNKRLVEFAKANPQITMIATQRALFEGAPVIQELNTKFGFDLNEKVDSPFDLSLFRDKAKQRIFSQLSHSLQAQLNAVWNELLELATFRSEDEDPHIVNDEVKQNELAQVTALISSQKVIASPQLDMVNLNSTWLKECLAITEPAAISQFLDASPVARLSGIEVAEWLPEIQERFELNAHVILAAAKLLQRLKEYQLAINCFQVSVSLGVYFPYIDMMIGQCWQALDDSKKSEFFFKKAMVANPNNPIFYTNYAKLLLVLNRDDEAEKQFELGYQKGRKQPACIIPYCEYLNKVDKIQKAIDIANGFLDELSHPAINNLLSRLMLKRDVEQGKAHYSNAVKERLAGKDTLGWLASSCKVFDSAQAEEDFMIRCLSHWEKLK